MVRFDNMKGVFGLLPTPYDSDLEIHTSDLRRVARFCCDTGQHGIVWPVMVGEYYFLGEEERIRNLHELLQEVDGQLPVVFGCAGVSVPQVLHLARAAMNAGADAIITMAPERSNEEVALDMYRRLGDVYDGPIMVQNHDGCAPLTGAQIMKLVEAIPQIQYVKEERQPGPSHIAEVAKQAGDKIKCIFGGAAGKVLPHELRRGANGCMPACEFADLLARIVEMWWDGDEAGARHLHTRLLPLINLENHQFVKYVLRRRGVIESVHQRLPGPGLDPADEREIEILIKAVGNEMEEYPFL